MSDLRLTPDIMHRFVLPGTAALIAGAINAMAGGGSFLSFPALLGAGIPPVNANTTNTVAMWPGELTSVFAFRSELRTSTELRIPVVTAGGVGGILGSMALLNTSQSNFLSLVPWLLLFATILYAIGGPLNQRLQQTARHPKANPTFPVGLFIGLLITSFYTGYFGAGAGILVFTVLSLFGVQPLNEVNALKALCTTVANGVGVIVFVLAGAVSWPQCFVMMGFASIGGYCGAAYSRRLRPSILRGIVIAIGALLSAYYFYQRR